MEVLLNNEQPKILYLSYDGLSDNLGQSQILPYIEGLSQKGIQFVVVSFEKKELLNQLKHLIQKRCIDNNIIWIPLTYHKKPPVISTLWDLWVLFLKVKQLHNTHKFDIVHCRSYITSLVGLYLKKKKRLKFVFDMRGFWADERIERNIWNPNKVLYKNIYHFFKLKEKSFFYYSDATITLTQSSEDYIQQHFTCQNIAVIPCSTNFNKVNKDSYFVKEKIQIIYLGSFRTAYLTDEMFLFYTVFRKKYPNAKFIVLTNESAHYFNPFLKKYSIEQNNFIIKQVPHHKVYNYLTQADLGLCFIKPSFSSIASSPTKFAEMLAANLPVVCNNIGDLKAHCKQIPYTYCLDKLNEETFTEFVNTFALPSPEERIKISQAASKIYDINLAIEKYYKVYTSIL